MLVVVAITFGGAGFLNLSVSSANAENDVSTNPTDCQAVKTSSSGGFCDEAGCEGGTVDCYAPPQGGMCFTSEGGGGGGDDEREIARQ